jgi:tyrosyl-tRNA synthetase
VGGWVNSIKSQVSQFLDFDSGKNAALVVNNLEWVQGIGVLDFLRDVGKHFSVNAMIQKDSVKQRLGREGAGISFTEFSYMILQSYDFSELYRRKGCILQIGGSDQWGNITGGIDLTRRLHRAQVYGLTIPLVTKSDGQKFGKTETGTIWLDRSKTSPYAFYQFWLNSADADVYMYLKYFTFLSSVVIAEIELSDKSSQGRPEAQEILAREVTLLVHGSEGLQAAKRISDALFSDSVDSLNAADLDQLRLDGLPSTKFEPSEASVDIVQVLVDTGLATSRKMAREFVANNAVSVNGIRVASDQHLLQREGALFGKYFVIKRGKKQFHLAFYP